MIESVSRLAKRFSRLPGIGPKSAQRLAYFVLKMPEEEVLGFAEDLRESRLAVSYCPTCGNLMDGGACEICGDAKRSRDTICVVTDTRDLLAVERTHEYNGQYHVLGGVISPIDGVGPEDIRVPELLRRLSSEEVNEVILATNPDVTGEATAAYIARLVRPMGVKVTRIAHGVPVGGDLEYTDDVTLSRAITNRIEY